MGDLNVDEIYEEIIGLADDADVICAKAHTLIAECISEYEDSEKTKNEQSDKIIGQSKIIESYESKIKNIKSLIEG